MPGEQGPSTPSSWSAVARHCCTGSVPDKNEPAVELLRQTSRPASAGAHSHRDQENPEYLVRLNLRSAPRKDRILLLPPLPNLCQRIRGQTVCCSQDCGGRRSYCGNTKSCCAKANRWPIGNWKMAFGGASQVRDRSVQARLIAGWWGKNVALVIYATCEGCADIRRLARLLPSPLQELLKELPAALRLRRCRGSRHDRIDWKAKIRGASAGWHEYRRNW